MISEKKQKIRYCQTGLKEIMEKGARITTKIVPVAKHGNVMMIWLWRNKNSK